MRLGLLAPTAGTLAVGGRSIPALARSDRRALYRRVQTVLQTLRAR